MKNLKMKFLIVCALSIFSFSCSQEAPTVKKKNKMPSSKSTTQNVKVVNAEDPICHMKTADYLKETAVYKKKTYGFCSASCKNEFLKNPEKYVTK